MTKRAKVQEKPAQPDPQAEKRKGAVHRVTMITYAMHVVAYCQTCEKRVPCGGEGAEGLLREWATRHASKVEIRKEEEGHAERVQL